MAQTKFKVEDGLLVRGQANVTGALRVEGPISLLDNVATNMVVTGNVIPTVGGTYHLGNTTNRWVIYAESINTTQPFEATAEATFYNNVTLTGNLQFSSNNYYVGNSTSQVLLYSTNTIISDTLQAGSPTQSYLTVNASTFYAQSNLISNGSAITLASNTYATVYIRANNVSIPAGLPSRELDVWTKTSFTSAKYLIQVTNNEAVVNEAATNDIYTCEALITYHAQSDTAIFTEYAQVFNNKRFLNLTASVTSTQVRLVAGGPATNVNVRIVRTSVL